MPTAEELEQLVNDALDCGIGAEQLKKLAKEAAEAETCERGDRD